MELTKTKEKAEDLIVQLRELVGSLHNSVPPKDREAQKEQLKVISNSIQHLENRSLPVPEDLVKLKDKLEKEIKELEKHQVLLFFLKDQLSQILSDMGGATRKGAHVEPVQKAVG